MVTANRPHIYPIVARGTDRAGYSREHIRQSPREASEERWQAPSASRPVHATVTVPGSKSLTNRALVLAALATRSGPSTISGALRSRDTDLMIGAVQTLGVTVDGADAELTLSGAIDPKPGATIDCGLAGTVLRFVPRWRH